MLHTKIYLLPVSMLTITIASGILTSSSHTLAENISPVDDEITVTVDSSCTMGIMSSSSITGIVPGQTKGIGLYRMATYCNDSNGYDIYAIGYTNGEYGNTNMQSTTGNTIPTNTSGTSSYWNMQLTPGTASSQTTHIPTIVSPFTNNTAIPSDYTKVVTYPSTTIPQGTDPLASGSYFEAAYYAHASTTQPAGTYKGQVQYVMVHPTGAPAPEKPYMQTISRWGNKLLPNTNDTIQAIDRRDGKRYWVTRLADGNIWMTQNLDFDIDSTKTYTSADTDLPEGTTWTPSTSTSTTSDWVNSNNNPFSYDPGELFWDGALKANWDGTLNNSTVTNPSSVPGGAHYHIGNYYNWTAAIAINNSSSYNVNYKDVNQSICPAGWRLPAYSGDKSYQNLIAQQGITVGTNGNIQNSPTYLIYGGSWLDNASRNVGGYGRYWSSIVKYAGYAYQLNFGVNDTLYPQYDGIRYNGYSIRCVAR